MTKTQLAISAELIAKITTNMNKTISDLKEAIAADTGGYIHAWPQYGLGVKIGADAKFAVVGVAAATVVDRNSKMTFRNGAGFQTKLMLRKPELLRALEQAETSLEALLGDQYAA